MVHAAFNRSVVKIDAIIERAFSSGRMSRQDHLQLASALLADYKISEPERRQINRLFDYVQMGRLKLID
jgi:hypothetical protein